MTFHVTETRDKRWPDGPLALHVDFYLVLYHNKAD